MRYFHGSLCFGSASGGDGGGGVHGGVALAGRHAGSLVPDCWSVGRTANSNSNRLFVIFVGVFKSASWDLLILRTFLKPGSPKTQIPGDGDSRRPRRPRRTTTHTHERRSGLLSAEAAEILLYRFRAPRTPQCTQCHNA